MNALFDTHCHLDAPAFDHDRAEVWARARAAGVGGALVPAVEPTSWAKTLAMAQEGRVAALGVHPWYLTAQQDDALDDALARLVARVREGAWQVVAIGECGFDGSTETLRAQRSLQRRMFFAHVEVARDLDLPLVVHVLRAHGEALAAMRAITLPRPPGVIHGFSGSPELAQEYLALGWHLAVGGAITRPTARRSVEAVRVIPLERLLLETDAPNQVPTGVPDGVRRCEPAHLPCIARRVADVRAMDLDVLCAKTSANARALFRCPG